MCWSPCSPVWQPSRDHLRPVVRLPLQGLSDSGASVFPRVRTQSAPFVNSVPFVSSTVLGLCVVWDVTEEKVLLGRTLLRPLPLVGGQQRARLGVPLPLPEASTGIVPALNFPRDDSCEGFEILGAGAREPLCFQCLPSWLWTVGLVDL